MVQGGSSTPVKAESLLSLAGLGHSSVFCWFGRRRRQGASTFRPARVTGEDFSPPEPCTATASIPNLPLQDNSVVTHRLYCWLPQGDVSLGL